ncbi:MAG: hypothetical protein IPG79_14320 [Saprospiraceae bacterium]|nr:hypothetical protein [Saprospiraceae bacterium]
MQAVKYQADITRDIAIINSVNNKTLTSDEVNSWMQSYGLFQGIKSEFRSSMVDAFISFVKSRRDDQILNIELDFDTLYSKLYLASGKRNVYQQHQIAVVYVSK